ncbi:MAG TPA: VIT and VWA domain-containing protein [Terriglobales bacterium]
MKHRVWGPGCLTAILLLFAGPQSVKTVQAANLTPGSLEVVDQKGIVQGACPLKHTEVRGTISGFLARVTVTQQFQNSAENAIEAVYTFPLPENAAVDDMTIQIGSRTIRGSIKERQEARAIYENAKRTGHVAALLDQERPNIFTQAIANIMPGEQVSVTISYTETLRYEEGSYEFVFPMVVGPRYIPGKPVGHEGPGWAPDTDEVSDASRITPHVAAKGTRAGHDISLELAIDAGVPIIDLSSSSHQIDVEHTAMHTAVVNLRNQAEIPNKDFILKYKVAGTQIADAMLTEAAPGKAKYGTGGYFTLILQPPARVPESDITPKELVFVLDTSGSMMGYPIEKGKELVEKALDELYPGDTFNLITFSGDTEVLFPEPVFPTAENIRRAKNFLISRNGSGGTEMMKAIRRALAPSDSQDHVRIVCFVTDGYVGNDMQIIGEVQKHSNARVFSFGIGSSVNRFLLDGMAKAGRGAVEYVTLNDDADEASKRLYERIRSPLLTDVSVNWGGLPVKDVYPSRIPDLFSGQPVVITGRYTTSAQGAIQLRGTRAGKPFSRDIPVDFSSSGSEEAISTYWARQKVDDLMSQDWEGAQTGQMNASLQKQITQLGLDYRLMTQYTSFIAVEEKVVNTNGTLQRVEVPVEMPEGVSYEGVFGEEPRSLAMMNQVNVVGGISSGVAGGVGSGNFNGSLSKSLRVVPAPPPPASMPTRFAEEKDTSRRDLLPEPTSPSRKLLESKLSPELLKALDCSQKGGPNCHVGGKLKLQIWLSGSDDAVKAKLKALGVAFLSEGKSGQALIGTLAMDKLEALAKIVEVKFVSLART